MPNAGIKGTTPRAKISTGTPSAKLGYSERIAAIPARNFGGAGYPLGILLSITMIRVQTVPAVGASSSTDKPHVRIKSN